MNKDLILLQAMHTPGIGPKRLFRILQKLQLRNWSPDDFMSASKTDLIEIFEMSEEMISNFKSEIPEIGLLSEQLWQHEIKIISILDSAYPGQLREILKDAAPPVLFVKGNLELLNKNAVGFCGSRKATETGSLLVKNAAAAFAKKNINVISGYAHGIDLAAHIGALENHGTTTFVLPLGILNFQLKASVTELISDDNFLVISEFTPRLGWEIHNAMRRNLTICGLSNAVILVEPGLKGGTFEAGKTALKYERPLFVVDHDGQIDRQGNEYFQRHGAKTLNGNENEQLDIDPVVSSVVSGQSQVKQQSLF